MIAAPASIEDMILSVTQEIRVECRIGAAARSVVDYGAALMRVQGERQRWTDRVSRIETPNGGLNDWIAGTIVTCVPRPASGGGSAAGARARPPRS